MSRLLENDHNVYILGAGFSRDAGLPLISDFLLRMRDSHEWLEKEGRTKEAEAVAAVLDFRLNAASAAYWVNLDLENIEELFSLASASSGNVADRIRLAIAATLDYSRKINGESKCKINVRSGSKLFNLKANRWPVWVKLRDEAMSQDSAGTYELGLYAWHVARLLGMFKDGAPQGKNTFITFNYDTLLEEALTELRLPVTYGSKLGNYPQTRIKHKANGAHLIPVFKLHGSVNWAQPEANADSVTIFKDYIELARKGKTPELIPPTWKKVFQNQLQSVWDEAIQKLNTATRIIVIGFSMPPTDMHFKYLLAAGLNKNLSLRQVLFVNPDQPPELEPRARKLFREAYVDSGRIAFNKENLRDFTVRNHAFYGGSGLHTLGRATEYGLQYNFF